MGPPTRHTPVLGNCVFLADSESTGNGQPLWIFTTQLRLQKQKNKSREGSEIHRTKTPGTCISDPFLRSPTSSHTRIMANPTPGLPQSILKESQGSRQVLFMIRFQRQEMSPTANPPPICPVGETKRCWMDSTWPSLQQGEKKLGRNEWRSTYYVKRWHPIGHLFLTFPHENEQESFARRSSMHTRQYTRRLALGGVFYSRDSNWSFSRQPPPYALRNLGETENVLMAFHSLNNFNAHWLFLD